MSPTATPWSATLGNLLTEFDEKAGVQVVTIDLADLDKYRAQIPILAGRRTDLYRTEALK